MFDLKNNDISTVLLLVVLGLLIWYLTKPNKSTEKTVQQMQVQQMPMPVEYTQIEHMQDQHRPIPVQHMQMPDKHMQMPDKHMQMPDKHMQVEHMQAEYEYMPVQQMQMPMPVQQMQMPMPVQSVNNFQDFDGKYSNTGGADINDAFQPQVSSSNKIISAVDLNKQNVKNYNAKDFLPKEINDQWFDTDFSQAKTNLNDDKLINTDRFVIGINTVGQSLKNASYDIRGTIANPKFSVSPWNNSTYEPDYNIKPLC
jgi:hypothetical protein